MAPRLRPRRIGVDTGGTFTDLVVDEGEDARVVKVSSTPDDPAGAVVDALEAVAGRGPVNHVVHGTTVALNALLTGRVAKTALVTGTGFRDLIEIGRQHRPDIYALHPEKPLALVPRKLRFEVGERVWPDPGVDRGGVAVEVARASRQELAELRERIRRSGAESVAVCLLHSFSDPSAEQRVARALAPLGIPVTASGVLLPEHREHERFSTAVANAALAPLLSAYLGPLEARLDGARLSVLQSNGGTLPAARAAVEPVRVVLSGPAGGVVGAARAAREVGLGAIVALDMGGTSTDVAFHSAAVRDDDALAVRTAEVAGHPLGVPSLDIHTIGCGGGSLVRVDEGGAMHVGPQSAGADPGPVCYGRSDRLTVTDAHVLLGHVREGAFLDGGLALDTDAVARAFERLAADFDVRPAAVARAVIASARAAMRRALSVMTMQRGQDPRNTPLVAFGGAGGLHAASLAESLGMPGALVPSNPGALSARGMAGAEAVRDAALTVLAPLSKWQRKRRREALREVTTRLTDELVADGYARRSIGVHASLDLRYRGQSFELNLTESADPAATFHAAHERMYGYRLEEREIELVCLRVRAAVRTPPVEVAPVRKKPLPKSAVTGEIRADFGRRVLALAVDRRELAPGHSFEGPAIVEEYSGTTLVPPGHRARVTPGGHLWIER